METQHGWVVTCEQHNLHRVVETERHAVNILNLHQRVDHADDTQIVSVNLTAAAAAMVGLELHPGLYGVDVPTGREEGALTVWQALTGLDDLDEALAYARELAGTVPPITAHIPPF